MKASTDRKHARDEGWSIGADSALEFEAPELNQLRDVWFEKKKAAGGLPARVDFDAGTLKPFLRHVSIVEREMGPSGRPSYIFRFYGSALTQRFGEQTGQFLEMSVPPDQLRRWIATYDSVLEAGRPMRLLSSLEIPEVSHLSGESFSAPLANGGRKPNTLLACTYFTPKSVAVAASV
jgi:hypothetical protein